MNKNAACAAAFSIGSRRSKPKSATLCAATVKLLAFLLTALALLVCDTAAGLASGLAGGLALAAATVLCALAKVLGLKGLDVFHN